MAGTFKGLNQAQIDKRLKEGRGQGRGSDYKPFIYTRDVSSLGRSHRLFGSKCQRMHHLLSDLELAVFLSLDWSPKVVDVREQFPLRVEDTVRIAEEAGLPHARFKGTPQVLSSDFLVDFDDSARPAMAIQAKYSSDLEKSEVVERLELERRYWAEKEFLGSSSPKEKCPRRHSLTSNGSILPNLKMSSPWTSLITTKSCICTSFSAIPTGRLRLSPKVWIWPTGWNLAKRSIGSASCWRSTIFFSISISRIGRSRRLILPELPKANGRRYSVLPVNQVFRIDEHRRRLLWCDAELAIWIDIDSTTALPASIPVTDLERLLMDGAIQRIDDPFLDRTLREVEEGSVDRQKRDAAWAMITEAVLDTRLFERQSRGESSRPSCSATGSPSRRYTGS